MPIDVYVNVLFSFCIGLSIGEDVCTVFPRMRHRPHIHRYHIGHVHDISSQKITFDIMRL